MRERSLISNRMAKSTKTEALIIIRDQVTTGQDENALPYMNPDQIDNFVTYLYDRVDLRSFERSEPMVKMKYYRDFMKDQALKIAHKK